MEPYQQLEHTWAEWNKLRPENMVVCSSGTAALHLALECVGEEDNAVAVPDFTMIACARACILARQKPIFVDCDDRLLMEFTRIPESVDTIMAVHIYGRSCDMNKLHTMRRCVIEDMSEIHGTPPHPGTDAACWSFYKNKIIAGEEGGAVYFRDNLHAQKARALRSLGFTDKHDFMHVPFGHNYRMSNVHAQLILNSITAHTRNLCKRRALEEEYTAYMPEHWQMPEREQPWVYDICVPLTTHAEQTKLVSAMCKHGVRHGFKPMSMQTEFRSRLNANSLRYSKQIVYLPLHPSIDLSSIGFIVDELRTNIYEITNYSRH